MSGEAILRTFFIDSAAAVNECIIWSNYSEPIRKIAAAQLSFCSCGVLAK